MWISTCRPVLIIILTLLAENGKDRCMGTSLKNDLIKIRCLTTPDINCGDFCFLVSTKNESHIIFQNNECRFGEKQGEKILFENTNDPNTNRETENTTSYQITLRDEPKASKTFTFRTKSINNDLNDKFSFTYEIDFFTNAENFTDKMIPASENCINLETINIMGNFFHNFSIKYQFVPAELLVCAQIFNSWLQLEQSVYKSMKLYHIYEEQRGLAHKPFVIKDAVLFTLTMNNKVVDSLMKCIEHLKKIMCFVLIATPSTEVYLKSNSKRHCVSLCRTFLWVFENPNIYCCVNDELPISVNDIKYQPENNEKALYMIPPEDFKRIILQENNEKFVFIRSNTQTGANVFRFCFSELGAGTANIVGALVKSDDEFCKFPAKLQPHGISDGIVALGLYVKLSMKRKRTSDESSSDERHAKVFKSEIGSSLETEKQSSNIVDISTSIAEPVKKSTALNMDKYSFIELYRVRELSNFSLVTRHIISPESVKEISSATDSFLLDYTFYNPYSCLHANKWSIDKIISTDNINNAFQRIFSNDEEKEKLKNYIKLLWREKYMRHFVMVSPHDIMFQGYESVIRCPETVMWYATYNKIWFPVEKATRQLVEKVQQEIPVYTFALDSLFFKNGKELVLFENEKKNEEHFNVPNYFLRVVIMPANTEFKSFGILVVNDVFRLSMEDEKSPFKNNKSYDDNCRDPCDTFGIEFENRKLFENNGILKCCAYKDLLNHNTFKDILPETETMIDLNIIPDE